MVVQHLATEGFVTFLAGYRLYQPGLDDPNAWPTQLEDAQRVIRWVRAHPEEFNVDPERVCAGGYSAGSYLAALLGTMDPLDDSDPELAGISSRPDCVLMLAGDGDLTVPGRDGEMAGPSPATTAAPWQTIPNCGKRPRPRTTWTTAPRRS